MTIAAKYEDGVFKPLEEVNLTEGTRADRDDIVDGVCYVDRLRNNPRG
jgi:predicted DNA-binding antitoxin AbrB/MazE fold protein